MKRRSSNALHDAEDKAAKRLKIIEKLQEDYPHVPVKRNMKLESIEQVYEDLKSNRMPHTAFLKKNKERIGQIKLCDLVKRIATKVRTPSVDELATAWNQLRGKTAAEWTTADLQCLIDSISGVEWVTLIATPNSSFVASTRTMMMDFLLLHPSLKQFFDPVYVTVDPSNCGTVDQAAINEPATFRGNITTWTAMPGWQSGPPVPVNNSQYCFVFALGTLPQQREDANRLASLIRGAHPTFACFIFESVFTVSG